MNSYEHYCLGNEYLKNCNYNEAMRHFLISLKIEPHYKTYEKMYHCNLAINQTQDAFDYICKAYQMNKRNDKTAFEYAKMLVNYKQDYDLAITVLKDILQRNSSYNPAINMLNNIENNGGNLK